MLCHQYDSVQVVFVEFGWCNSSVFFPAKIVYSAIKVIYNFNCTCCADLVSYKILTI